MREVGPFEILESLGAGGMGEVFKARDRRLNRFVALKFLPEAAAPAARDRFQREALVIAALNHPHICTLYEIGDDQGRPYLVLELLEGETLRARLRRAGAASGEQLLDWGAQIADALDAAHRKGVLHRDLKPENIWVGPSGHIKVLDFGLARLEDAEADGEAATVAAALTSPGQTMGTIPYMSPEQARGEALDARSDLFSFGSVFYEMATGKPAFPAKSAAESMAAILKEQPPSARKLRPELPPKVEEVASRCLEKDPDLRYQSAADLRSELKRLKRESGSAAALPAVGPAARRGWLWPALGAAAVIVLAGLGWWRFDARSTAAPAPSLHFRQITFDGHVLDAVISPDGKFLAHVDAGPQGVSLHLLSIVNGSDVQIMPPAPGCCYSPSFSPDGSAVYFLEKLALKAVPVLGGAVRTIAPSSCSGAGFSPDGSQIAFVTSLAQGTALTLARADGSGAHALHEPVPGDGYVSQCWGTPGVATHSPAWSPDGRWIALNGTSVDNRGHVELVSTSDGQAHTIGPDVGFSTVDPSWLPDSRGLVFTAAIPASARQQVWRLDISRGRTTQLTNDLQGYYTASVSALGELAVVHLDPEYSIWTKAAAGREFRQLPGGGVTQDGGQGLAWTPQGGLVSLRDLGGQQQLWAENADGSEARPLLASGLPAQTSLPVVTSQGAIIVDGGTPPTLQRINPDGSGLAVLLPLPRTAEAVFPVAVLGGRAVAYLFLEHGQQQLYLVPAAGGAPRLLWPNYVYADGLAASPDGTRIFAVSQGPDQAHVPVVLRVDGASPQVTPVEAFDYKSMLAPYGWTPDGRAITYIVNQGATDNIWALPLDGGKPYAITHFTDLRIAAYAFSRDGRLAISRGSPNADAVVATGLVPGGRQ